MTIAQAIDLQQPQWGYPEHHEHHEHHEYHQQAEEHEADSSNN